MTDRIRNSSRLVTIDLLRTIAVLSMILYHLLYDLEIFYGWRIGILGGGWKLFGQGTATLFLLLVGMSFMLSWQRSLQHTSWIKRYAKYARRGTLLLVLGTVISVVTYLFDAETYVRFGILHLIGTASFIMPFAANFRWANVITGILLILAGNLLQNLHSASALLLPFGMHSTEFMSVDYFPILPWLGVILVGCAIGKNMHTKRSTQTENSVLHILAWPGRHALALYLIHQPFLLAGLRLVLGPM